MKKTIFDKIKDKLTIEYLADMLVFEANIEDGDYDYEENYVERWDTCYRINIPEEFRDNDVDEPGYFNAIGLIGDDGYGYFSTREEAVAEAIRFLKHVDGHEFEELWD